MKVTQKKTATLEDAEKLMDALSSKTIKHFKQS
jgi:hypothetical protein